MFADQATGLRRWLQRMGGLPRAGAAVDQAADAPLPFNGPLRIAVASGKGGVGKTNVSANLAIAFAQLGRRVLVVGADLGLANVELLLGLTPQSTLLDVLEGRCTAQQAICNGPAGVKVLAGGAGAPELARLNPAEQDLIVSELEQLSAQPEVVIVDTGAGVGDNVLSWFRAVDRVLVVTTPEPGALSDAYALLKLIAQEPDVPRVNLVVNQATDSREGAAAQSALIRAALQLLDLTVDPCGIIPRDDAVPRAVREQTPVLLGWPSAAASQSIRRVARSLLQAGPQPQPRPAQPTACAPRQAYGAVAPGR